MNVGLSLLSNARPLTATPTEHEDAVDFGALGNEVERQTIIGGSDVPLNRYPWFVRRTSPYGFDGYPFDGCGGSLVSPEFVLLAASCGSFWQGAESGYQVGALCEPWGNGGGNCGQDVEFFISGEFFVRPDYDVGTLAHDIALVKLPSQATIDPVPMDVADVASSYVGGKNLWMADKSK